MFEKVRSKVQRINPDDFARPMYVVTACVLRQFNCRTTLVRDSFMHGQRIVPTSAYCCGCSTFFPNSGSIFATAATINPGIVAINTQRKKFL